MGGHNCIEPVEEALFYFCRSRWETKHFANRGRASYLNACWVCPYTRLRHTDSCELKIRCWQPVVRQSWYPFLARCRLAKRKDRSTPFGMGKLSMEVTRLLPMLRKPVEKRIHSSGQAVKWSSGTVGKPAPISGMCKEKPTELAGRPITDVPNGMRCARSGSVLRPMPPYFCVRKRIRQMSLAAW